jgi:hypothetical protein
MQTQLKWHFLTIMLLFLLSFGQAQEKQPPFSIIIRAPQTVKAGTTVPLAIAVQNISSTQIRFATDVSKNMAFDFLFKVRNSEGKEALETPYYRAVDGKDPHSIYFSRMHKSDLLLPGEILKLNMDLTQLIDFKPGTYTIQLSRPEGHPPTPREPNLYGPFVTSNIINLAVTP